MLPIAGSIGFHQWAQRPRWQRVRDTHPGLSYRSADWRTGTGDVERVRQDRTADLPDRDRCRRCRGRLAQCRTASAASQVCALTTRSIRERRGPSRHPPACPEQQPRVSRPRGQRTAPRSTFPDRRTPRLVRRDAILAARAGARGACSRVLPTKTQSTSHPKQWDRVESMPLLLRTPLRTARRVGSRRLPSGPLEPTIGVAVAWHRMPSRP
jgi:hypothetical protein